MNGGKLLMQLLQVHTQIMSLIGQALAPGSLPGGRWWGGAGKLGEGEGEWTRQLSSDQEMAFMTSPDILYLSSNKSSSICLHRET